MANPTVYDLIQRVRGMIREETPTFWKDTDPQMLGWVTQGLEQFHALITKSLDGPTGPRTPDPDHKYWSQFWKSKNISIISGTTDYDLPNTEADNYDIFHSLVDATGRNLTQYDLRDELMIKRGGTLGVGASNGRFAFLPAGQIRILVTPGALGVPKENQTAVLRYFRNIKHHEAVTDTVDIRDEFTTGPVNYACYQALMSKRIAAPAFFEGFVTAGKMVSGVQ